MAFPPAVACRLRVADNHLPEDQVLPETDHPIGRGMRPPNQPMKPFLREPVPQEGVLYREAAPEEAMQILGDAARGDMACCERITQVCQGIQDPLAEWRSAEGAFGRPPAPSFGRRSTGTGCSTTPLPIRRVGMAGPVGPPPGGTVLLFISVALAQHVDVDATDVLTVDDLPWEASAVGHPALWSDEQGFTMLFESSIAVAGCDEAYRIGHATSPDGHSWTVDGDTLGPTRAAPCGFRAPEVANTSDGLLILARAAHDDSVWARRHDGRRVTHWRVTGLDDLESFSVARRDGTWFGVGVDPDLGMVTLGSPDAHTWTRDSEAVLPYGSTWWSLDGMLSPSVSCFDGAAMPWVLHYGGWTGTSTGFTYGISDDLQLWFLSLAADIWTDSDAWDAWDSVATASSAWVAYAHDGRIGWATTSGGVPLDPATRDCTSTP